MKSQKYNQTKAAGNAHYLINKPKIVAFKNKPHWTNGLNRRQFMQSAVAVSLLATMSACKPSINDEHKQAKQSNQAKKIKSKIPTVKIPEITFNDSQVKDLDAIFLRLFPEDGNGPSARELNVTTYLQWAMTDEQNINDGDPEFIAKGIGWLNQLAQDEIGKPFIQATHKQQDDLITQTSQSKAGKNWLGLLLYYLVEAITLDPFYGGNTNQIGWNWLEHQGGFPHPIEGKTYRDFD